MTIGAARFETRVSARGEIRRGVRLGAKNGLWAGRMTDPCTPDPHPVLSYTRLSRVTSVDYAQPYRPWPIAFANQIGRALEWVTGGPSLAVDDLIAAARAKTGLVRFGDESFREALGVLVDSIEREAELHPVGRAMVRRGLVGVLSNRLRAEALFERHPEILEQPIIAPVFIVGLQRAGTTMLHRLLAADPGLRALLSWEALRPAPITVPITEPIAVPNAHASPARDPRIGRAMIEELGLRYMAPDFCAVHSVEAHAPDEEVVLLDHSFLSTVAVATLRVPTYAAWLERQDQRPAYEYLKKMLQLLQWQRPGERWILKTPHHLEWLDTLLAVFPDAAIIQTHRDPLKSVASFSSMICHAHGVFSDRVDPGEIGAQWAKKTERMLSRAMATRDRTRASSFIDVSYYDLLADPLAEVERIYCCIGRRLSREAIRSMQRTLRANPQHKNGAHSYALADFGLTARALEPRFAEYRARHAIRFEQHGAEAPRPRFLPLTPRDRAPRRASSVRSGATTRRSAGAAL